MTSFQTLPHLLCVGLSHKTSTVMQRECFASLDNDWASSCVTDLKSISEWVLLSTCNRVELYLAVQGEIEPALNALRSHIAEKSELSESTIEDIMFIRQDFDVAKHLFSVAAGLESMVVGESEILGQVSHTYADGVKRRTFGPTLDALFRAAIYVGKRVRAETSMGSNHASVSSVALDTAAQILGDLSHRRVTVIGLGAMGQLTLKLLRAKHVDSVTIVNRTIDKAQSLAEPNWKVLSFSELPQALADSDLVISATRASHPVVAASDVRQAIQLKAISPNGSGRTDPLVIIDMAIPRDVENEAAHLPRVMLFDLDDLKEGVESAIAKRQAAIPAVNRIIDEELTRFHEKLRELRVRPMVVQLRTHAEQIREQELERTLRYLGNLDPDTAAHLQHLTRALVNKLLHKPTVRLKEIANEEQADDYLATVRDLFGLDESPVAP